jgi:hypothetical protein
MSVIGDGYRTKKMKSFQGGALCWNRLRLFTRFANDRETLGLVNWCASFRDQAHFLEVWGGVRGSAVSGKYLVSPRRTRCGGLLTLLVFPGTQLSFN